jgi:hypothetical protein
MPGGVQGPGKERTMKHIGFLIGFAVVLALGLTVSAALGATDSHDNHGDGHKVVELSEQAQTSLDKLHETFMEAWALHGEEMAKICQN